MYYIESDCHNPAFNLALEQYVFDVMDRKNSYFMLWQNEPSIIIGKNQNTAAEINQSYVREHQIQVVRRLSGGGAVYHDKGNINFTFITDQDGELFDFSKFCIPVIKALKSVGVKAEITGRNDIEIEGKKFSGNSQYAKEGRVMHHGTIMYDSDLEILSKALAVSPDKMKSKACKSVRSRVTNVKPYIGEMMSTEQFFRILREFMFQENQMIRYRLKTEELQAVREIQRKRYDTWDWNYGFSPNYAVEKKRRVENCGTVEIHVDVKKGQIERLAFSGDYFSSVDSRYLADYLVGVKLNRQDLEHQLEAVEIRDYFHNLSKDEFVQMLLE